MADLSFLETDSEKIYDAVITKLEEKLNEPLYPGDERRIFAEALVSLIVGLFSTINDSAKQVTLRYARNEVLDALGEFVGVSRITSQKSETTIRFSLKETISQNIIIPQGTRITNNYASYFATKKTAVLQAGKLYIDIEAESIEAGSSYNNIKIGSINSMVDLVPYVDQVSNIEETFGGCDEEDDDSFRERIRLATSKSSVAGPKNLYKALALSANPNISDAYVYSDTPGTVIIVPILQNGKIPEQYILDEVLEVCSADDVRPLTDKVEVMAPTEYKYDIEIEYYTNAENETEVIENIEGTGGAVEQYIYWQGSSLNRNINPDYLRKLILCPENDKGEHLTGADRVIITSPTYTVLDPKTVATFSGNIKISHKLEG